MPSLQAIEQIPITWTLIQSKTIFFPNKLCHFFDKRNWNFFSWCKFHYFCYFFEVFEILWPSQKWKEKTWLCDFLNLQKNHRFKFFYKKYLRIREPLVSVLWRKPRIQELWVPGISKSLRNQPLSRSNREPGKNLRLLVFDPLRAVIWFFENHGYIS